MSSVKRHFSLLFGSERWGVYLFIIIVSPADNYFNLKWLKLDFINSSSLGQIEAVWPFFIPFVACLKNFFSLFPPKTSKIPIDSSWSVKANQTVIKLVSWDTSSRVIWS